MPTKGALTVLRVLRSWWCIAVLTHGWRIKLWWSIKGLWNPRCCAKAVLSHRWSIELWWSIKWLWSHRRSAIDDRAKRNSVYICPWRRFLSSFLRFFFQNDFFFWMYFELFPFACCFFFAACWCCCLLLLLFDTVFSLLLAACWAGAWTLRILLMRSCLNAFHCSVFIFN